MRTAIIALASLALVGFAAAATVADQKTALLQIAEAAKSNFWRWSNPTGHWDIATDPCVDWDYVDCDGDGNVESLDFFLTNLQGKIAPAISKLTRLVNLNIVINTGLKDYQAISKVTSLTELAIGGNGLSKVPVWITKLVNLQQLYLTANLNLQGPIPADLGKLTKLNVLSLSANKFNGELPEAFSKLTNLVWLDMAGNRLTGNIPKKYTTLTNLAFFALDNNKFKGPIPVDLLSLETLGNLDFLGLCGNDKTFVAPAAMTVDENCN